MPRFQKSGIYATLYGLRQTAARPAAKAAASCALQDARRPRERQSSSCWLARAHSPSPRSSDTRHIQLLFYAVSEACFAMQPSHRSKAADFEVLKTASNALLDYFRMDETQPDLYEQISSHDNGAQKYYIEPYHTIFPVKTVET